MNATATIPTASALTSARRLTTTDTTLTGCADGLERLDELGKGDRGGIGRSAAPARDDCQQRPEAHQPATDPQPDDERLDEDAEADRRRRTEPVRSDSSET